MAVIGIDAQNDLQERRREVATPGAVGCSEECGLGDTPLCPDWQ